MSRTATPLEKGRVRCKLGTPVADVEAAAREKSERRKKGCTAISPAQAQ
jgi:hypothetical protein